MPITSDRDKVRLKVGDTDTADPLLFDDEIDALLADEGSVTRAAIAAARAIAAKFARGYTFQTDGQRFNRAERVAHYRQLAKDLATEAGITTHATTRVDGYSDDVDYQDVEAGRRGRVRAGYTDPDLPV
jgi:hypothetical protein